MALTTDQKSSNLFKKQLGVGETTTTKDFFEEPKLGRSTIYPTQIWSEYSQIPTTAPTLTNGQIDGVVQYFQDLVLTQIPGVTSSFYHSGLTDTIPFNFGDGSYNYVIKDSTGTAIPFGQGNWILDTDAGLLTFYGTTPSNMPPKVSFYKYVGEKGMSNVTVSGGSYEILYNSGNTIVSSSGLQYRDDNLYLTGSLIVSGASSGVSLTHGVSVNSIQNSTGITNSAHTLLTEEAIVNYVGSIDSSKWEYVTIDTPYNYGNLYNWYAVDTGLLAPDGYWVPSSSEMNVLRTYLGGYTIAGGFLKSTRTSPTIQPRWGSPNSGAVDSVNFNFLPSGYRNGWSGDFEHIGLTGNLYTSDANFNSYFFSYITTDFGDAGTSIKTGMQVRFIRGASLSEQSLSDGTYLEDVQDYDGNWYKMVKIGTQVWSTQSLKTTSYNDGTPIPEVKDNSAWAALTTGAYCTYNNEPLSTYEDPTYYYSVLDSSSITPKLDRNLQLVSGVTVYSIQNSTGITNSAHTLLTEEAIVNIVNVSTANVLLEEDVMSMVAAGAITAQTLLNSGMTFTEFVKQLLTTTFYPTIGTPSFSLTSNISNGLEIGSTQNLTLTFNFTRGNIMGKLVASVWQPSTFQAYVAGPSNNYIINGVSGPSNVNNVGSIILQATQSYTGVCSYDIGAQATDSSGDNFGTPYPAGTSSPASTTTITAIYPFFYGKVSGGSKPTKDQALINSGTKVVSSSTGTITVSYNSTGTDWLWFAIPATSTSKTIWYVNALNTGNIGGVTNLFDTETTVSINSPESLWSGVSYKIYVSNYQNSVTDPMQLRNS